MSDYLIWVGEELESRGYDFTESMEAIMDGRMDIPEDLAIERYLEK